MSTETYNFLNLILQIFIWMAMLATLWVYYGQLRAMRSGATGQNILSLVNFLQTPHVRESRTIVRQQLKGKSYDAWTPEEKRAADMVCSTYDVAAILIFQESLVPARPFVENWGASIRDCYEILLPHIQEMQRPDNSGTEYWKAFGQMYTAIPKQTGG